MTTLLLTLLAVIANTGDYITTIIGIKTGYLKETNPICRWLLKYPYLLFIVKILWINSALIIANDIIISISFVIIMGGVCINNIYQIRKTIKYLKRKKDKNDS